MAYLESSSFSALATLLTAAGYLHVPVPDAALSAASARACARSHPFVLRGLASTSPWAPAREWRHADGSANVEAISRRCGDFKAPVVREEGSYGAGGGVGATTMTVREYLEGEGEAAATKTYLKDWHLVRDLPSLSRLPLYSVPLFLADDLLNAFFDARASSSSSSPADYRFSYCGRPGTATPLHYDVLSSHSWSANIAGWKLWLFFAGDGGRDAQERDERRSGGGLLYDGFGCLRLTTLLPRRLMEEVRAVARLPPLSATSPPPADGAPLPSPADVRFCLQGPGDVVIVPPGHLHEVLNLGPGPAVVSVNHNGITGADLPVAWSFMMHELGSVRRRIADCRRDGGGGGGEEGGYDEEWERQCQVLLRANAALNYDDFGALLLLAADRVVAGRSGDRKLPSPVSEEEWGTLPLSASRPLPPHEAPHVALPRSVVNETARNLVAVISAFVEDPYVATTRVHEGVGGGGECGGGSSGPGGGELVTHLLEVREKYGAPALRPSWTVDDLRAAVERLEEGEWEGWTRC
jgi:hypothetical protein